MKLTRNKIILAAAVLAVLAFAFWYGGNAPGLHGWGAAAPSAPAATVRLTPNTPSPTASAAPQAEATPTAEPTPSAAPTASPYALPTPTPIPLSQPSAAPSPTMAIDPETGKDKYLTEPVPSGKPLPVEPQDVTVSSTAYTCTLSVSCATILEHMDWLDSDKTELVPGDGVLFPATEVTFYEGESVFNVLQRETKKAKLHMEFENTPIYNSAYIEGVGNLYEFDCGELSGWMYKVNGWFPNYGCSRYQLQDGDIVEWVYTCDLGKDVGDDYLARH